MSAPGDRVLRVGLTGNIGAGKSTVAAMLAARGCRVIDADRLGHGLLRAGSPVLGAVVEAFGEGILDAEGNADRKALAAVVFANVEARRRLEAILHPAIRDAEGAEAVADPGNGIVVTEAALLVETGGHERYDRLVVVTAPEPTRLDRLAERGLPRARARQRMAAQMQEREKVAVADYVVDNGGTLARTEQQVEELTARLREDLSALQERRG